MNEIQNRCKYCNSKIPDCDTFYHHMMICAGTNTMITSVIDHEPETREDIMQKWEYMEVYNATDLKKAGLAGWEAYAARYFGGDTYYLKHPIE